MAKKLTEYQQFVKDNASRHKLKNNMVDMKAIGALWRSKKGGKSSSTSKPKKRSTKVKIPKYDTYWHGPDKEYKKIPKKKPAEKKVRKTSAQKAKSQSVPVSALEKRTTGLFQKLEQVRLALAIPKADFKLKQTRKGWSLKVKGWKVIKSTQLSKIVAAATKKARSRV